MRFFSFQYTFLMTYLWKTLTLAITFEPEEVEHSYFRCIPCDKTLKTVPNFLLSDLDLAGLPTFQKKLSWDMTLESEELLLPFTYGYHQRAVAFLTTLVSHGICANNFQWEQWKWPHVLGCFQDLRRFNNLSVISRLGSRSTPISNWSGETGIQSTDPLLYKPRAQLLNHSHSPFSVQVVMDTKEESVSLGGPLKGCSGVCAWPGT